MIIAISLLFNSCEKVTTSFGLPDNPLKKGDVTAPSISSVLPANNATSVVTSTSASVTFSEAMNPATLNSSTLIIKQGTTVIPGSVSVAGLVATFTPAASLSANTLYTGTVTSAAQDIAGNPLAADYTWNFTTAAAVDVTPPTVLSVVPAASSASVSTTTKVSVTFSEPVSETTLTSSTFTLKQGTTNVSGTISYTGSVATFTPSTTLLANKVYTGTITTGVKDPAGNAIAALYTWSFTTSSTADVTPPTVSSVTPSLNATSVALNSKLTITFSESMDASTINATNFTLKQGSTTVQGTVSYTGTTATFTPATALSGNTQYTASISAGAKDASGNALASAYSWSFTTLADIVPPTILSVTPLNNATNIAVNTKLIVTFSEPMTSSSINSSTFTLTQGSTSISGSVIYSGTTATLTPSASLTGNTVYTGTITTVAKDAAGNALASNYVWTFTTVAVVAGKSFSADVVPILNICNTCHTHPWTTSSNASTFYTNLVNGGYVNPASPSTSKIYTKLNSGHPGSTVTSAQVNTILTWMTEGSKNN